MLSQSEPGAQLSMFNLMFKSGGEKGRNILQQKLEPSQPIMGGRGLVQLSTFPVSPDNNNNEQFSNLRRLQAQSEGEELKMTSQLRRENDGPFSNILLVGNNNLGMN